jgi:hypothetical protein
MNISGRLLPVSMVLHAYVDVDVAPNREIFDDRDVVKFISPVLFEQKFCSNLILFEQQFCSNLILFEKKYCSNRGFVRIEVLFELKFYSN